MRPFPATFGDAPYPGPNHPVRQANVLSHRLFTGADVPDLRVPLHDSAIGTAVVISRSAPNPAASGYASRAQAALPVAGLFTWLVGNTRAIIDVNTTLFIAPGQEYAETHPLKDYGHASAIVAANPPLVEELVSKLGGADPFSDITRPATPRGQVLAHRLMELISPANDFCGDELMIEFLVELSGAPLKPAGKSSKRVIIQAKEYLHGLGGGKLSLDEAAREIGVSPIYLTQCFKASEGVPLYRYYLNARLSQALTRLPQSQSIIALALELGFSSHSHFSAAFAARYGFTPSSYRDDAQARRAGKAVRT